MDESQIKILEDTLKEVERKLKNCLNAVANGIANKSVEMITNLEEDKEKLNIYHLRLKSKKTQLMVDNFYQFLLSLAFFDTKKEKNKNYNDGTGGDSESGSLDGETDSQKALITTDNGCSLGTALSLLSICY